MHPAAAFSQSDRATLERLVSGRGFALITAAGPDGPVVAHAPVLLAGETLRFHVSRANRINAVLEQAPRALAVVTGADAYVSPDWYAAADQVPTWNYVAAEIEGPARVLDAAGAAALLDDLSAHFEARLAPKPPWTRAKMTPVRFEAMLAGIVAWEMRVERLAGTWKLSQNKSPDEAARVAAALEALPDEGSQAVARLMRDL
ncbi:MAG TPA: FMN-binding negative transcriptional regulator [Caulobacteraceae bacterium]|nr:FMN-binding negative transcriptional regulator [Caulobacteraceae bacterium]